MKTPTENPFYSNHIFSLFDTYRTTIKWWQYPFLFFRTTYVQVNDGFVFHYKIGSRGEYYLMKIEIFNPTPNKKEN